MSKAILYERIKLRRKQLGLTQDDLASMIGYSNRSAIARIENGSIDLPQSKIIAFADALKTTPGWLMERINQALKWCKYRYLKIFHVALECLLMIFLKITLRYRIDT